jgi:hypothetical protein
MIELSDEAALQKRATRVALRTMRQRTKVVGHTEWGEPIFEVRSVPLLLRRNASYFNRLVACAGCGRDLPGDPVFGPSDLSRESRPVVCNECDDAPPPEWSPELATSEPDPPLAEALPEPEPELEPEPESAAPVSPGHDNRLLAIEAEVQRLSAALTELVERDREDETARAGLKRGLVHHLTTMRAEMSASADATAARIEAIEGDMRGRVEASGSQALPETFSALCGALEQTREELRRLVQSHDELARAHSELNAKLVALDERLAPPEANPATPEPQGIHVNGEAAVAVSPPGE